jgi:hypothetical protein
MDGVVPPDPSQFMTHPAENRPPGPEEAKIRAEETVYASLGQHPGWKLFKRDLAQEIYKLETLEGTPVAGKSMAEVGEMYVVARQAAETLRKLTHRIDAIAANITAESE